MIQERGEGAHPLVLYQRGQEGGKSSRPFHKIYLFKHEQALAEVIICVKAVLLHVPKTYGYSYCKPDSPLV